MSRMALIGLAWTLLAVGAEVRAAACSAIGDPAQRLACYDGVAECADVTDDRSRLACYDAVAAATVPEAPAVGTRAPASAEVEPFPVPGRSRHDEEPARLVASIAEVIRDHRGRRVITLDNGQIWRELSQGRTPLAVGVGVELTSGALGSVNLRPQGSNSFVKVRRIE